jgi:SAM-dependent methyltransferase
MTVTRCPGCGGQKFHRVGRPAPECATVLGGESFVQPPYSALRCEECGLIFKSEMADPDLFPRLYSLADYRTWEIDGLYPTERMSLAALRGVPPGGRILDFGCSSGRLLAALGPEYERLGLEINAAAASVAQARGIRIVSCLADVGALDAALLVDVFEHLMQPLDELKLVAERLKPGGLLVLTTGDGDAPACRDDPAGFWYFRTVQHLIMLTRQYAEFLQPHLDATLISWQNVSHYDTPATEKIFQWARRLAYDIFHASPPRRGRWLASMLPFIRRARHWTQQPQFTCSADHVVAVFRKNAPPAEGGGA